MATLRNTTISDTEFLQFPTGTTAQRPAVTAGQMRFNSTIGKLEFYSDSSAAWIGTSNSGVVATGGTVYDVDVEGVTYRVHVFTNTGNSTFTVTHGGRIEYLIVAGGGSGGSGEGNPAGDSPGGGGAGGLITGFTTLVPQSYTITVGNGASTRVTGTSQDGSPGQNSSAFGLTAIGGGAGGREEGPGGAGGSGGGGGGSCISGRKAGGSPTSGQGNPGGTGGDSGCTRRAGAGGGGAGIAGGDDRGQLGGWGGNGLLTNITGLDVYYAGGGGAGNAANTAGTPGAGGLGGGGAGGTSPSGPGTDATPNTGGGGGGTGSGTSTTNGLGGSGIVVVKYPLGLENSNTAPGRVINSGLVLDIDFARPTVYNGTGTTVYDSRLNGFTGSLINGPTFVDPRTHRSSFRFNGSNNYIITPSLGPNNPLTQITLEAWCFPRRAPSTGTIRGAVISGHPSHYLGIIDSQNGGATHALHWALQTTTNRPGSLVGSIPRFAWSHIVGTYDGANMRAFINGVLVYDVALTGNIQGDGRWTIGTYLPTLTDGTHNWDGEIAISKIYNRALSQAEIQQSFNATRWRFGV